MKNTWKLSLSGKNKFPPEYFADRERAIVRFGDFSTYRRAFNLPIGPCYLSNTETLETEELN